MFGATVPLAVANDLMNRELSATDYDVLLQLDRSVFYSTLTWAVFRLHYFFFTKSFTTQHM